MNGKKKNFSDQLLTDTHQFSEDQYPLVTIIIPSYNCAPLMGHSLSSIFEQSYPHMEIIVIDATSKDRTLEVAKSYRYEGIRIYSVSEFNRYEMINKGITLSTGSYLSILFPGDTFISSDTLKIMMNLALTKGSPDLVFSGCLLRGAKAEVKILYRHLTLKLLKRGQQPTSLESCWFKPSVFETIGKFNPTYTMRGGFELLCRYVLNGEFKTVSTNRVLTDYNLILITKTSVFNHFKETGRAIWHYFGFFAILKWFIRQRDIRRWFKMWFNSILVAFSGRQA